MEACEHSASVVGFLFGHAAARLRKAEDLLALSESVIEPQGNWPMGDCMSNRGALASR